MKQYCLNRLSSTIQFITAHDISFKVETSYSDALIYWYDEFWIARVTFWLKGVSVFTNQTGDRIIIETIIKLCYCQSSTPSYMAMIAGRSGRSMWRGLKTNSLIKCSCSEHETVTRTNVSLIMFSIIIICSLIGFVKTEKKTFQIKKPIDLSVVC